MTPAPSPDPALFIKDLEVERLATLSKTLEGQSAELQSHVDNLTQSLATTEEELAAARSQIQVHLTPLPKKAKANYVRISSATPSSTNSRI